jgi:hypothetical protein
VAGLRRDQIVMLDLAIRPVTVSIWATTRYQQQCSASFATYMRDVDVSPDGSYFVAATTGAYRAGSLCDTAARWETGATGPGQQPTWADYTGGDTLYSVAVTGAAVYVGGHQRWMNNSFAADRAGPGAVAREGIAALDPVNGLPLSWNPGRDRGVGVFALVATAQGLWIGSDTERIGRYEHHARIAFVPLAGGTPVPEPRVGTLPGDLFRLGLDGAMTRSAFDGTTAGPATPVALNGLTSTQFLVSRITGMTMASGRLLYASSTGTLSTVDFPGGLPTGPATTVSGPATDGQSWQSAPCSSSTRPTDVPVSCAPPAPVAQGTEQLSPKQQVAGSSPARGTNAPLSQVRRARKALSRGRQLVPGVAQRSPTRIMPRGSSTAAGPVALPLADKSADVLLSVFGVIFAPDGKPQPPSWPAWPPTTGASCLPLGCPVGPSHR